ncbi:MAG: hypothetical protein FJW27_09350 [Acidimicrobiia bacterium]|nr:hypothetical protein [Acidimicrobiia bacterium]
MSSLSLPTLMNLFVAFGLALTPALAQTAKPAPSPTAAPASAATGVVASFKGTAANLERVAGETITIDIRRWSTEEERSKLVAAYSQGAQQAAEGMQKAESVGYIWRSGSGLGQSVRYAIDTKLPDGRQRVVLVTTENILEWNRRPGAASTEPAPPLTAVELRLPAAGPGEGKLSAKVTADSAGKLLTIDGYEAAPVVFRGVTRTKR